MCIVNEREQMEKRDGERKEEKEMSDGLGSG